MMASTRPIIGQQLRMRALRHHPLLPPMFIFGHLCIRPVSTAMALLEVVVLCACLPCLAESAIDLSSYQFRATLNTEGEGGLYELYWSDENETICFAVRVQTTGWVGFGLSPDGQMPNSDVVIGWEENGEAFLHDRYATARDIPPIDVHQDWFLIEGEEENGFTTLVFIRNLTTCDERDLPIQTGTAHVIWSFSPSDPSSPETLFKHTKRGSISVNLLGGLSSVPPDPDPLETYDVLVDDIEIPSADTTYWCAAFRLPEVIRNQTKYVTKFAPNITRGNEDYLYFMQVYLCRDLNMTDVGSSGPCETGVSDSVRECRGGELMAVWAKGGKMFQYPENIGYAFGGPRSPDYVLLELYYEGRPELRDSSGIRFYYTSVPQKHNAGILEIGHAISTYMIIPPNTSKYKVAGMCMADCTEEFFPVDGIHIFAAFLHTHSVGREVTIQHTRYNSGCDVYEELEPIDKNLQYDPNFQQFSHLPQPRTVLQGDILTTKCSYGTQGKSSVVLGGIGKDEEVCLSYPIYYPRVNLTKCQSHVDTESFMSFANKNFPQNVVDLIDQNKLQAGLDALTWNERLVQSFQEFTLQANQFSYCESNDDDYMVDPLQTFPNISCPYTPPDICTCYVPPSCCVADKTTPEPTGCSTDKPPDIIGDDSTVALKASVTTVILFAIIALYTVKKFR